VNALDKALRSAPQQTFRELGNLELADFKVRILTGQRPLVPLGERAYFVGQPLR
jgi:hypothetical protein